MISDNETRIKKCIKYGIILKKISRRQIWTSRIGRISIKNV